MKTARTLFSAALLPEYIGHLSELSTPRGEL